MYKLLGAVVGLGMLLLSSAAGAASIAFKFDNGSAAGAATGFGPAISSVSNWSMSHGTPDFVDTLGSLTVFDFVWGKGWNGTGNDYTFTFNVQPGFTVTLTDFSFFDASGSFFFNKQQNIIGPTNWWLSVDGNLFGAGSTHGGIGGVNTANPPDLMFGAGTHTVLLHGYGAASAEPRWAIDNFVLNGGFAIVKPVPLPAAAWLLGSALLGMVGFGRRKNS